MTVFLTIFAGVCVYVIGQLIMKLVIEPLQQHRETIGKVASFLIYHANRFTSPGIPQVLIEQGDEKQIRARKARLEEMHEAGRNLATELVVRTQAIPCYSWIERIGWATARSEIAEAQRGLFFITNNLFTAGQGIPNYEQAKAIEAALGIVTEFNVPEQKKPGQPGAGSDDEEEQG